MRKKFIAGLGLSAVLVILLAATIIFGNLVFPNCDNIEKQINELLKKANYCNADSDCKTSDVYLGCPFGCYNLVNKNSDLSGIKASGEVYGRICGNCVYRCQIKPTQEQIKCRNGKCIDNRFENSQ